jgi:hypothetical protein
MSTLLPRTWWNLKKIGQKIKKNFYDNRITEMIFFALMNFYNLEEQCWKYN